MAPKKKTTTKKKTSVKKASRPKKAKAVGAEAEVVSVELTPVPSAEDDKGLRIHLSESLMSKLVELAGEEGISSEELIQEMVSEAVTLRAFDQWEKRQHLRGHSMQQGQSQGNHGNNNNNRRGNRNRNRKNMNHSRYQNLMEDNSSFLEYVRNQEKKGGR